MAAPTTVESKDDAHAGGVRELQQLDPPRPLQAAVGIAALVALVGGASLRALWLGRDRDVRTLAAGDLVHDT